VAPDCLVTLPLPAAACSVARTLRTIAAQAGAELPAGINPDQKILLRGVLRR
jgi:hypothetical protein